MRENSKLGHVQATVVKPKWLSETQDDLLRLFSAEGETAGRSILPLPLNHESRLRLVARQAESQSCSQRPLESCWRFLRTKLQYLRGWLIKLRPRD